MAGKGTWQGLAVFTIGHSTRTLDQLVTLLHAFSIAILADVRTIPRSRHNPQFNTDVLSDALAGRGVRYVHLARLGGLRHRRKDSPNTAWRNASFQGFADYMMTDDFASGLEELRALAVYGRVALMCAEAVPWRCHRSLIADALTARGALVEHISSRTHASPHRMTPFARVQGTSVTYPGDSSRLRLAPPAVRKPEPAPATACRPSALATTADNSCRTQTLALAKSRCVFGREQEQQP